MILSAAELFRAMEDHLGHGVAPVLTHCWDRRALAEGGTPGWTCRRSVPPRLDDLTDPPGGLITGSPLAGAPSAFHSANIRSRKLNLFAILQMGQHASVVIARAIATLVGRIVVMQQESHVIAYESPGTLAISAQSALLSCLPGVFALVTYAAHQWQDVPKFVGYLFWPLLAVGVVTGFICFARFRRAYRGRSRPWFVSLSIAAHFLVLLVGVPFLLLLVVGALTGNLR
jgi:hypothetical protein